ncbi:MAG: YggS family pyridoxal phosphate-dependent enzyme [Bdellovibrionales bacterium]|nr:YggS family pyridoxal phosphate-dependent enzyme [Bdellovibrionales bacterium]
MKKQYEEICKRIDQACVSADRAFQDVTLVAVSKKQSVERIKKAYDLGIRNFGENYVQELLVKKEQLPKDIRWHFIGDTQSRKIPKIAGTVYMVHSLDRESQLEKWVSIEKEKRPLLLLQVNLSKEETKSGVMPDEVEAFLQKILQTDLVLNGLMVFPPNAKDAQENRAFFSQAKALQTRIQMLQHPRLPCVALSQGVSNDFEVAIEEGATHVRLGTILFGER